MEVPLVRDWIWATAVTYATAAVWILTHCATVGTPPLHFYFSFFFLEGSFFFFRVTPMTYARSQSRGQVRAAAAGLHHSHSNTRSKLHLWPTPHLVATPDPLTHWVRPRIESTSWSWILHPLSHNGNPLFHSWSHFPWSPIIWNVHKMDHNKWVLCRWMMAVR